MVLFLGSVFCSVDLYVLLCQYQAVLITMAFAALVLLSMAIDNRLWQEGPQQLPTHNLTNVIPTEKDILFSAPAKVPGLTLIVSVQVTCPLLAGPLELGSGLVPQKEKEILLLEDVQQFGVKKARKKT